MHLLVGLLTGSNAQCRLQAVRCLHELSHSSHTNVAPACLPATPYLLTYLSGPSTKFTVSHHAVQAVCDIVWPTMQKTFDFLIVRNIICTQELCLYTLGNMCPDSDVVREKLLAQGIIPALASCIEVNYEGSLSTLISLLYWQFVELLQLNPNLLKHPIHRETGVWLLHVFVTCYCVFVQNQRHTLAVVEAAAFTLSQLLQARDAPEKIIP